MGRNIKSAAVYALTAVLAFTIDKVYSLFSHGVSSAAMSSMWLWLLGLGSFFYLLLEIICRKIKNQTVNRLPLNIYNSGTAVFVTGMLLQGILEIAGTGSAFILYYRLTGAALMIAGVILLLISIFRKNKGKFIEKDKNK